MAVRLANPAGGVLRGTTGTDVLWGEDGPDTILGRRGADLIYGGSGDDVLHGGAGSDYVRGASGEDVVQGGSGADLLSGGSDADRFVFRATETSTDVVRDFRPGEDQLVLGPGLRVDGSLRLNLNFDDWTDTVLSLSNGANVVLLGVCGARDWSSPAPTSCPCPSST